MMYANFWKLFTTFDYYTILQKPGGMDSPAFFPDCTASPGELLPLRLGVNVAPEL